jgi:carbonic anhydrase/acetyltransferase-like protein (isoleucine patch superfamily)
MATPTDAAPGDDAPEATGVAADPARRGPSGPTAPDPAGEPQGIPPWPEPQVHPEAWVAASAVVIGAVRLEAGASLWPTAVARADLAPIVVGEGSNVQDGAVLHGDPGLPVRIGADVTVGHRAVIHGATLEDGCLVGIGAVVLNGVTVGAGALVAAGAVVTRDVAPGTLVMGAPAQAKRELSPEAIADQRRHARRYRQLAWVHAERERAGAAIASKPSDSPPPSRPPASIP